MFVSWSGAIVLTALEQLSPASLDEARLKQLVQEQSFAVDSMEGDGVAQLLAAIEGTCRDKQALPFMGELVPRSWLQVSDVLQRQSVAMPALLSRICGRCTDTTSRLNPRVGAKVWF